MTSRSPLKNPAIYSFRKLSPAKQAAPVSGRSPERGPPGKRNSNDREAARITQSDVFMGVSEVKGLHSTGTEYMSQPQENGEHERGLGNLPVKKSEYTERLQQGWFRRQLKKSPDFVRQSNNDSAGKGDAKPNGSSLTGGRMALRRPVSTNTPGSEQTDPKKGLTARKHEIPSPGARNLRAVRTSKGHEGKSLDNKLNKKFGEPTERLSDFLQNDLFGQATSPIIPRQVVFKNELLEKINSEIKPVDEQLVKSEVFPKRHGTAGGDADKRLTLTQTLNNDTRLSTNFASNKKPAGSNLLRIPLTSGGQYTNKLMQLQANKVDLSKVATSTSTRQTLLGAADSRGKEASETGLRSNYMSERVREEEAKRGSAHSKNYSPTRTLNLTKKDESTGLKVRKKTIKINKVEADKRIANVVQKVADHKMELPIPSDEVVLERIPSINEPVNPPAAQRQQNALNWDGPVRPNPGIGVTPEDEMKCFVAVETQSPERNLVTEGKAEAKGQSTEAKPAPEKQSSKAESKEQKTPSVPAIAKESQVPERATEKQSPVPQQAPQVSLPTQTQTAAFVPTEVSKTVFEDPKKRISEMPSKQVYQSSERRLTELSFRPEDSIQIRASQPMEPIPKSLRAAAKPKSQDIVRPNSKRELGDILKNAVSDPESKRNIEKPSETPQPTTTSSQTRSTSVNIEGSAGRAQTGPLPLEYEIVRRMENMPEKYPRILNAFLKFEVAPSIYAIGYNSHQGYVRDYNEDRISVVFSDRLQSNPKVGKFFSEPLNSFGLYSVFDGHNGFECSEFLKNNLHNVLLDQAFTTHKDFDERVKRIYSDIEVMYKLYSVRNKKSFAGSCAITVAQYNDRLVVINVGDSRCILSTQKGCEVLELSIDHKPESITEFKRISAAGGFVYRSLWSWITKRGRDELVTKFEQIASYENASKQERLLEVGPWRANAGGLSVSRTFGDFEAKYKELGGTPGVIICEPDVFELELKNADFIVIGCKLNRRRHF